jgi:secondary thiamine-phosphate synthase enzyme
MSRRSSVTTVREQPVADVTSLTGTLRVQSLSLTLETGERFQIIDLTERVMEIVRSLGVKEGIVHLFSMHTTCTIFINEFQTALLADIRTFLEHVVEREAGWRHNDPAQSDCDRMNADSHLRAMLLGHTLTVQVSGGELVLGRWQRLLLAELDGPRTRTLRLTAMGIG